MNKNLQNKEVSLETIRNNKKTVITGRTTYFTELVKVAVNLSKEIANESDKQIVELKSMLINETITIMTSSWRNTLPFNLFVSKGAEKLAKSLGIEDLRNHDYSLKFGMDKIIDQIEEPDFLAVAENLNDQDLAKLNKALSKDDKALNSNVMLHWEHAFTGKMFINAVTDLINNLSESNASEDDILEATHKLVEKQAIVWILKTENYLLIEKGFKDLREPNWESAYKECNIELSELSKADYNNGKMK